MKIITDTKENITGLVAEKVRELVKNKPDAVIGFSAGNSFKDVFSKLQGEELKAVRAFSVCEYAGCDNLGAQLESELYSMTGIVDFRRPKESEPESYDEEISACGGLDLVLLGVGLNGSIGFNEPATPFDSLTHLQQLTDATKRMKAEEFGGEKNVPSHGVTMGLKTLFGAKSVILLALGEEKAPIVRKLVHGRTDTYIPAAMLQLHMNMTLCLDNDAASKLD
ncbi:MAG: 6-phosphogluconolactonase [Ruminiclostridium sp.]|nr:6-phosphogluconolactonase [Ruminiclostridium sp.]MCF0136769.1 6-phosphogluconolactonase [Oscillospiraceae bacterium]